jgi:hypothetical protein
MKAVAIVHFAEPQPPFEMLGERQAAVVHMVENPELHRRPLPLSSSGQLRAISRQVESPADSEIAANKGK